jgi:hypothetical protein
MGWMCKMVNTKSVKFRRALARGKAAYSKMVKKKGLSKITELSFEAS